MRRIVTISGLLLLAGLVGFPVAGRVFRAGGSREGWLNTTGLPWGRPYHTTMEVDGRRMQVYSYSVDRTEPVVEQLKAQFKLQGADAEILGVGGTVMGKASWEGGEARIMVLAPDQGEGNVVMLFYPEEENVAPCRIPEAEYPGGELRKTVVNEDTGTALVTVTTRDPAQEVLAFYAGRLSGEGWVPLLPGPSQGVTGGMAAFRRDEQVCCVLARENPGQETLVTVLVRNGRL